VTSGARGWRRTRCALAPGLIAVGVLLSGCGSSGSVAGLDTGKIERAIAGSSLAQRGLHARVSCPADVPQAEGLKFSCAAVVGAVTTRFVVEQDEAGHVHFEAP
jgi:shikimate kinase